MTERRPLIVSFYFIGKARSRIVIVAGAGKPKC